MFFIQQLQQKFCCERPEVWSTSYRVWVGDNRERNIVLYVIVELCFPLHLKLVSFILSLIVAIEITTRQTIAFCMVFFLSVNCLSCGCFTSPFPNPFPLPLSTPLAGSHLMITHFHCWKLVKKSVYRVLQVG